jgi:hypothetical protein
MELRKDISKFITQICEKNYSSANSTLETLIEKKLKEKVKKMHKACCEECGKKKKKKVVKENLDDNDFGDFSEPEDTQDRIPNLSEEQPEEGDYVISSSGNLGGRTIVTIVGNKTPLGKYTEEEDAERAIKDHMRVHGHCPVWFNDDHGGYTLRKL